MITCLNPSAPCHLSSSFFISGIFLLLWHCWTMITILPQVTVRNSSEFLHLCTFKDLTTPCFFESSMNFLLYQAFLEQTEAFGCAIPPSHPTGSFPNSLKQKQKTTEDGVMTLSTHFGPNTGMGWGITLNHLIPALQELTALPWRGSSSTFCTDWIQQNISAAWTQDNYQRHGVIPEVIWGAIKC